MLMRTADMGRSWGAMLQTDTAVTTVVRRSYSRVDLLQGLADYVEHALVLTALGLSRAA